MPQNCLVKITLQGLLLISFRNSGAGKRCQAGVLVTEFDTEEEHDLKIEVKGPGVSGCYTYSHGEVIDKAPLWLYVGTENGDLPTRHTARPHEIDDEIDDPSGPHEIDDTSGPHPFSHVLDMEEFHEIPSIKIKSGTAPTLNIPQGEFHSDKLEKVKYKELGSLGGIQEKNMVATETFAEIDLDKAGIDKPQLILWSEKKSDSLFRISLKAGASYEVSVKNAPSKGSYYHHPFNHFRYYYHAFAVQPPKRYEIVMHHPPSEIMVLFDPAAPPCIIGRLIDDSLPD